MKIKLSGMPAVCLIAAALVMMLPAAARAVPEGAELTVGKSIDIVDQAGRVISKISRQAAIGDEVITCDGDHYRVESVGDNRAVARSLGRDKAYLSWCSYFKNTAVPVNADNWQNKSVAIYHTHSDESYIPTDGRSSIPFKGGIYQVGAQFAEAIKNYGPGVHYDRTPHDPHDAMAYVRSRRTAVKLMQNRPAALFDVHRDGIPDPNFYHGNVNGKDVSRLRLVIGRQNPKNAANLDFAKRLMAYANQKNPKIVKEIFIGSGSYNQDLMSTALLLEAGTYTNHKVNAEEGIALLAQSVPVVLGLTEQNKGVTGSGSESRHWWVLLVILLTVVLGGGAFALLNAQNGAAALSRFRGRTSGILNRVRRK